MPWNSTWPIGNISVKANRTRGNQNMSYIEATMGNSAIGTNTNATRDHFWNVGANPDGRHRFINSMAFTVGGNPANPVIGAGMDAVLYLKQTSAEPQWFTRPNAGQIYQVSPNFIQGTVNLTQAMTNIAPIPANCYGDIYLWRNDIPDIEPRISAQAGFFKSNADRCDSWSYLLSRQGNAVAIVIKLGNGSDGGTLFVRGKTEDGANGPWNYRITYRAM
jgi:hypothetical protein